MRDHPVLLVTGGSRGIGASVCRLAAAAGWQVAVNYASNPDAAEAVVSDIRAAGGTAVAIEGDVGTEVGLASIFSTVDATFSGLDGLVNNAGIIGHPTRLEEISVERLDRMFAVNVIGCLIAGVLAGLAEECELFGPDTRLLVFTGLLGGFTTFSAFGLDALFLLRRGEVATALLYAGGSVVVGLAAAWIGWRLVALQAGH